MIAPRRALPAGLLLLCLLPFAAVACCTVGAVHVPSAAILAELFGTHRLDPVQSTIVFALRLPRLAAAAVVGASLAAAGVLFQGLFRNALADPYVIGTSSGSVLGASVAVLWFPTLAWLGFGSVALFAFGGATVTVLLVYLLARGVRGGSSDTLLLAGFALGTILNSGSLLLQSLHGESTDRLQAVEAWLRGSILTPSWPQVALIGSFALVGLVGASLLLHWLNSLSLGEEYAGQLGIAVPRLRAAAVICGALLTACAVTLGGLVGFVGLLVPAGARLLLGPDNRGLLLPCAAGGALFVMLADTAARTVFAPAELPVGVLMALLGGPCFLLLLARQAHIGGIS